MQTRVQGSGGGSFKLTSVPARKPAGDRGLARISVVRLQLVRERAITFWTRIVTKPEVAAELLARYLDGADREHFVVLCLDTKKQVTRINTVSIGTVDGTLVHPREVFKSAIEANSSAVILAHNHPTGIPTPSAEDHAVTQRLVKAGQILGVEVLDHIIIGDGRHVSFREMGLMDDEPSLNPPTGTIQKQA